MGQHIGRTYDEAGPYGASGSPGPSFAALLLSCCYGTNDDEQFTLEAAIPDYASEGPGETHGSMVGDANSRLRLPFGNVGGDLQTPFIIQQD